MRLERSYERNVVVLLFFHRIFMLLLVDHSRVVLEDTDASIVGSDYINASYINVSMKCLQACFMLWL